MKSLNNQFSHLELANCRKTLARSSKKRYPRDKILYCWQKTFNENLLLKKLLEQDIREGM